MRIQTGTENPKAPSSVDEAAERLIADLLLQHLRALSELNGPDFEALCDQVTPYLLDEFEIWQGNTALLASCYSHSNAHRDDPARIILNRMKELLENFKGYLVISHSHR